jgi:hypothetical protein
MCELDDLSGFIPKDTKSLSGSQRAVSDATFDIYDLAGFCFRVIFLGEAHSGLTC